MSRIKPIRLKASEPCPCLSGRTLETCCMQTNGHLRKETVKLTPPAPKTRYSHTDCYLANLSDCSVSISAEHYMSKAVLAAIGSDVSVNGVPWLQPGERRIVGINNLTAKILCGRHNSALAPLDQSAGIFFAKLQEIFLDLGRKSISRKRSIFLASGEMLELWMLKVACGLFYSKNAARAGAQLYKDHEVDQDFIINALFQNSWAVGCGLYVRAPQGHLITVSNTLAMAPLTLLEEKKLVGVLVNLSGLELNLVFDPSGANYTQLALEGWTHRPSELIFAIDQRSHTVALTWEQGTPAKSIRMTKWISRLPKKEGEEGT